MNDVFGMHDLAVASNTTNYRTLGGKLYVHEVGWINTSKADRQAIVGLFPDAPIYETGLGQMQNAMKTLVKPYWPNGAYVTCINGMPASVADMQTLKNASIGLSQAIGVYVSPNDGKTYKTQFSDPRFDDVRSKALIGGALCIDAPPQYYLAQPAAYEQWTADEVAWAVSAHVIVVYSLFPDKSVNFWGDTQNMIADLKKRGATPSIWAVNGYYGSAASAVYPIGSEDTATSSMYTALKLIQAGD